MENDLEKTLSQQHDSDNHDNCTSHPADPQYCGHLELIAEMSKAPRKKEPIGHRAAGNRQ